MASRSSYEVPVIIAKSQKNMPFAGLALHVVIALLCVVHAVRSRQRTLWLFFLFALPFLGVAVYFFAVYLRSAQLERGRMAVLCAEPPVSDPAQEEREARLCFAQVPTAQNQVRLACALLEIGDATGAALQYDACLKGRFARNPEVLFGAARSFIDCRRPLDALKCLESLRQRHPDYRPEAVSLFTARALAGASRMTEARIEIQWWVRRFGTYKGKERGSSSHTDAGWAAPV